jgi:hypothetical protein
MKHTPSAWFQLGLPQPTDHALQPIAGASFPLAVKLMASAMLAALFIYGSKALTAPAMQQAVPLGLGDWGFLVAVVVVIGSGYWGIMTSQTICHEEGIEQTWLWRKQVRFADIRQVKLINIPALSWLVVPRLVVRTSDGLATFHAGDPAILARFKLLAHGE